MIPKEHTYLYSPHQLGVTDDLLHESYELAELNKVSLIVSAALFDILRKDKRLNDFTRIDWEFDPESYQFVVKLSRLADRE